jgi:hypothetical protein
MFGLPNFFLLLVLDTNASALESPHVVKILNRAQFQITTDYP